MFLLKLVSKYNFVNVITNHLPCKLLRDSEAFAKFEGVTTVVLGTAPAKLKELIRVHHEYEVVIKCSYKYGLK